MKINYLLTLLIFSLILSSCAKDKDEIITYVSNHSIKGIVYHGFDELTIKYGEDYKVEATGKRSDIENYMDISYIDDELNIERNAYAPESTPKIKYIVTTPELKYVKNKGVGDINISDFQQTYSPIFFIEYKGDINIKEINGINEIIVQIKNSGNFNALSTISDLDNLIVGINGFESVTSFGSFNGFHISSKTCIASIEGPGGDINITVQDSLDASIGSFGNGNINYKGYPVITTDITGIGGVIDMN